MCVKTLLEPKFVLNKSQPQKDDWNNFFLGSAQMLPIIILSTRVTAFQLRPSACDITQDLHLDISHHCCF